MDRYRELGDRLRSLSQSKGSTFYQGIVKSIEGTSCTVNIEGLDIPDIRLRASLTEEGDELLITPKVGTAVIVGSLSGDINNLAVLSVDVADTIVFHGGKQGGLVISPKLVARLNSLEEEINSLKTAIKTAPIGTSDGGAVFKAGLMGWAGTPLVKTQSQDIENPNIKQ